MINFNAPFIDVTLRIDKTLDATQNRMLGKLAKAAKICAKATYDLSQIYCPIDTGALRASAVLEKLFATDWRITYGNELAWYAERVHEIEKFRHALPTKCKYLEDAVIDLQNGESGTLAAYGSDIQIMSYQQILDMVFRDEDVPDMFGNEFVPSDEPIPM